LFEPTTSAATFDIRRYYDNNTSPELFTGTTNTGNNITTTVGSADAVVNMKSLFATGKTQAGWVKHRYGGHRDSEMLTHRFISLEFQGVQKTSFTKIYEVGLYSTNKGA
jgi:putative heme iron utilization protein